MTKINRIKGGIYRGYCFDFYTNKEAKKIAHKQNHKGKGDNKNDKIFSD